MRLKQNKSYWAGRGQVTNLILELDSHNRKMSTLYLTCESIRDHLSNPVLTQDPRISHLTEILEEVPWKGNGLVIFSAPSQVITIQPAFPILEGLYSEGILVYPLLRQINNDLTVAVILLRLGRYAIGVLRGEKLISSKTGSRYVKNRHKAGGSSQRRFARSRERLIRELYDKTCEITQSQISPNKHNLDYVLLGGEKTTLDGFLKRCTYLTKLNTKILSRSLQFDIPNHTTLTKIQREVWKYRVTIYE